jgi:hypothetical protein
MKMMIISSKEGRTAKLSGFFLIIIVHAFCGLMLFLLFVQRYNEHANGTGFLSSFSFKSE